MKHDKHSDLVEQMWARADQMWDHAEHLHHTFNATNSSDKEAPVTTINLKGKRWGLFWHLFKIAFTALLYGKTTIRFKRTLASKHEHQPSPSPS